MYIEENTVNEVIIISNISAFIIDFAMTYWLFTVNIPLFLKVSAAVATAMRAIVSIKCLTHIHSGGV